jgi:hypothetical protein
MNHIVKKKNLLTLVLIATSNCSTTASVVDTATSAAIDTAKGIIHYSTCPFTKKECF